MAAKELLLLRHAKSSWDDPSLSDHDRPLTPKGRRAATSVGRHLQEQGIDPDVVVCSSATRTRQTLELLQLDSRTEVLVETELYGASADELLARLRRVDDGAVSVLLIGHNPGIHDLAIALATDHDGLPTFPTAALAAFSVPISSWADLRPGVATLQAFVTRQNRG